MRSYKYPGYQGISIRNKSINANDRISSFRRDFDCEDEVVIDNLKTFYAFGVSKKEYKIHRHTKVNYAQSLIGKE